MLGHGCKVCESVQRQLNSLPVVHVQMVQRYEALSAGAEIVESQLKDSIASSRAMWLVFLLSAHQGLLGPLSVAADSI